MGQKLTSEQSKLYKRIDEILWEDWDPIGVNDHENIRDEYQSYVPKAFRLALEDSEVFELANYLNRIATENMGLQSNLEHCTEIAELIKLARNEIYKPSAL